MSPVVSGRTLIVVLGVLIAASLAVGTYVRQRSAEAAAAAAPTPALVERLRALAQCGVVLGPRRTPEDLVGVDPSLGRSPDWVRLLVALGSTDHKGKFLSDSGWVLPRRSIRKAGDYERIAARLQAVAGGALPVKGARDKVDLTAGEAWLELDLPVGTVRLPAKVEGENLDPAVLAGLAGLYEAYGRGVRLTSLDLGGDSAWLGASTEAQLSCLRETTRLPLRFLEGTPAPR